MSIKSRLKSNKLIYGLYRLVSKIAKGISGFFKRIVWLIRWGLPLKNKHKMEKLVSKISMSFAFAVTEAGENAVAGDYFTAYEMGQSLKKLGHEVQFVSKNAGEWNSTLKGVDVLISMLQDYDVKRLAWANKDILTIGWARNWFDSWAKSSKTKAYDYIIASSEIGEDLLANATKKRVGLIKIASNTTRFNSSNKAIEKYKCDYCFTGSYWGGEREVSKMLDVQGVGNYTFKVFGANWDKVKDFKEYNGGFVSYEQMKYVYASTKIVIDDANIATKQFGSVNSRVFDALASGVLVITNGQIGAEATFKGMVPVYNTAQQLTSLLKFYLENQDQREQLAQKLQHLVTNEHSYDVRAGELMHFIKHS